MHLWDYVHYNCNVSKELKMQETAKNGVGETIKRKAIFVLMVYFVLHVI